jgi:hypothetical protein
MAQNSQHHQKTRTMAVAALIVGVLGLGTAFAALGTTLQINGSAKIGSAKWDIRWKNLTCAASGEAKVDPAASISTDNQTITINAKMIAPNDSVTCNFDAVNEGDLDATLSSSAFVANTASLANINVNYTFKYRSNSGGATTDNLVGAADLDLASGASHQMQLVLTNANNALQNSVVSENFSFSLPYVQKNV